MHRRKLLLETFWDYICCSFIHRFFLFCLIGFANRFITHSSCHSVFLAWQFGYFLLISVLCSFVLNKWRPKRRTCLKGNQWHFETTTPPLLLLQSPSALLLPVAIPCCLHAARKPPSQQQAWGEGICWLWLFGSPQRKILAVGGSAWPQGAGSITVAYNSSWL